MIQILIKSFNRAYYLDRCLQSIQKFVKGDYEIIVLDDGTPEKYLNKIRKKYPEVEIQLSSQYSRKIKAIQENLETGKEINGFQIPTNLWYNAVKNASDYVLVTEDDVWFTEEIDLDKLAESMKRYGMVLIKLGWISQRKIKSKMSFLENRIISIQPKIFTAPKWFMKNFVFKKRFKVYSLMYRFGLVDNNTMDEFWVLNALLMGLYKKEYWLELWRSLDNRVDEQEQLLNAIQWFRKNKADNLYGKLDYKMMNTTFQSSATNSYHRYGNEFDVNRFNFIMNEAWYNEKLDSMNNFPSDISQQKYIEILEYANQSKATSNLWLEWSERFKEQYRKQQVKVD